MKQFARPCLVHICNFNQGASFELALTHQITFCDAGRCSIVKRFNSNYGCILLHRYKSDAFTLSRRQIDTQDELYENYRKIFHAVNWRRKRVSSVAVFKEVINELNAVTFTPFVFLLLFDNRRRCYQMVNWISWVGWISKYLMYFVEKKLFEHVL